MLGRRDAGVAALHFGPLGGVKRGTRGPRVAESRQARERRGRRGLVASERRSFEHQGAQTRRANGERSLEDLREMVIDRILDQRPHHRVVRPERCEAAADTRGQCERSSLLHSCRYELVQVGVRVATVDEALAIRTGVQLAVAHRQPLSVQRRGPANASVVQRRAGHHCRLRERLLHPRDGAHCWCGACDERNALGHEVHGRARRTVVQRSVMVHHFMSAVLRERATGGQHRHHQKERSDQRDGA